MRNRIHSGNGGYRRRAAPVGDAPRRRFGLRKDDVRYGRCGDEERKPYEPFVNMSEDKRQVDHFVLIVFTTVAISIGGIFATSAIMKHSGPAKTEPSRTLT